MAERNRLYCPTKGRSQTVGFLPPPSPLLFKRMFLLLCLQHLFSCSFFTSNSRQKNSTLSQTLPPLEELDLSLLCRWRFRKLSIEQSLALQLWDNSSVNVPNSSLPVFKRCAWVADVYGLGKCSVYHSLCMLCMTIASSRFCCTRFACEICNSRNTWGLLMPICSRFWKE